MAGKRETVKIKNFFVHNNEIKTKQDFTPEEFSEIQAVLTDRFIRSFGYEKIKEV